MHALFVAHSSIHEAIHHSDFSFQKIGSTFTKTQNIK